MEKKRWSDGPAAPDVVPRDAIHPGELLAGALGQRGVSASAAAQQMRVPTTRLSELLRGRRGVSPETALRLGRWLGTGARFWLDCQTRHDLARAEWALGARVRREVEPADPEDDA
jgi:antitoxin HigA-1